MDERTCAVCGKRFVPNQAKQRYCSRECYRLVNNARAVARKQAAATVTDMMERRVTEGELDEMAQATANACRALDALTARQRMRLEILMDTEGESDGQDCD